ncbi:MAG: hypothetical protein M1830_002591, partial [Pleopsidium flavum]
AGNSASCLAYITSAQDIFDEIQKVLGGNVTFPPKTFSQATVVEPFRGKITVRVEEAKDLIPSHSPFAIVVVEGNEYISKGPNPVDPETNQDRDSLEEGIQIWETPSRPVEITNQRRQSSKSSVSGLKEFRNKTKGVTNPEWHHEVMFTPVKVDISICDGSSRQELLGHVEICYDPSAEDPTGMRGWFALGNRDVDENHVSGSIFLTIKFERVEIKEYNPDDFRILEPIGKGQVYRVQKKDTQRLYAMKVILAKRAERTEKLAVTASAGQQKQKISAATSSFLVTLKFTFQTPTERYMVTDFKSGGELFWHLPKEGRFSEAWTRFYVAEIISALQHLHDLGFAFGPLKPEHILLDATGHIALSNFGFPNKDFANNKAGLTEYSAPETLLDDNHTKVSDFWSLGILMLQMCCGWNPFYAEDTQQMYKNIAFGKVRFARDVLSDSGRGFIKGLLSRDPARRLGAVHGAEELQMHDFFVGIDWTKLSKKLLRAPFTPKPKATIRTMEHDPEFTAHNDKTAVLRLLAGNSRFSSDSGLAIPSGMNSLASNAKFSADSGLEISSVIESHFRSLIAMNEDVVEDDLNEWPLHSWAD